MNYQEDMRRIAKDIEAMKAIDNPFNVNLTGYITAIDKLYQDHSAALADGKFASPELKQQEQIAFTARCLGLHLEFNNALILAIYSNYINPPECPCTNMSEAAASWNIASLAAPLLSPCELADLLAAKPEQSPSI